jgi:hypothetical protein
MPHPRPGEKGSRSGTFVPSLRPSRASRSLAQLPYPNSCGAQYALAEPIPRLPLFHNHSMLRRSVDPDHIHRFVLRRIERSTNAFDALEPVVGERLFELCAHELHAFEQGGVPRASGHGPIEAVEHREEPGYQLRSGFVIDALRVALHAPLGCFELAKRFTQALLVSARFRLGWNLSSSRRLSFARRARRGTSRSR